MSIILSVIRDQEDSKILGNILKYYSILSFFFCCLYFSKLVCSIVCTHMYDAVLNNA